MPRRQIARTLGIDRKSIDRHLAKLRSKGAGLAETPTGEASTGSEDSKGAKAPIGSSDDNATQTKPSKGSVTTGPSHSPFTGPL
jgi:hypothetical protein